MTTYPTWVRLVSSSLVPIGALLAFFSASPGTGEVVIWMTAVVSAIGVSSALHRGLAGILALMLVNVAGISLLQLLMPENEAMLLTPFFLLFVTAGIAALQGTIARPLLVPSHVLGLSGGLVAGYTAAFGLRLAGHGSPPVEMVVSGTVCATIVLGVGLRWPLQVQDQGAGPV